MKCSISFQQLAALVLVVAGAVSPVHAQRDLKDIPPPDPELERQTFQLPEGFEVNLFAADPAIAKPIQMNFDPQGRLWLVSSEVYPHIKPGQEANDKVLILEDSNADGRSDRTTVFADGLLIPTGIEPGDGGAYVGNSTELLHLSDTDGDGQADRRRVVLSGFGTEDTHHIVHTLRWGPGGRLYFNQSIYIHSHIETPYGARRLNGGGIWRFQPENLQLEVFARGFINPWGYHFDQWGQSFATDGAGGEGINYIVPGAAYPTAVGVPRILHGLNPGSPKFCGLEVVSGQHLPKEWQGNLLTNDFRGHRVCRFVLSEDGSGFAAREQTELIKTDHVAFRPVDIKMGPDGAIYIADWYNPIIQHGEVDFRDSRRDHTHGRIWRVTYKGSPLVPRPQLVGATTGQLLDFLKSPEDWTRQNARRVLKERAWQDGKREEVARNVKQWIASIDPDAPQAEQYLLEALWIYQALDTVEPQLITRLLAAEDHRVRAAATRVIQDWQDRLPNGLDLLADRVIDEHPRVRLEAVRVLGSTAEPQAVVIAMRALDFPVDQFLDYALWLTARDLKSQWLPLVQSGQMDFEGRIDHLLFTLKSLSSPAVVGPLMRILQSGQLTGQQETQALDLLATLGGPAELKAVLDLAMRDSITMSRRIALLQALAGAMQKRDVRPAGDLATVGQFLETDDTNLQAAAARCLGLWKVESARPKLIDLARGAGTTPQLRQTAIQALAQLGDARSHAILKDLAQGSLPDEVRRMAVVALVSLDIEEAAEIAVPVLAAIEASSDPATIFSAFLQRKGGPAALARAVSKQELPADVAKIGLRVVDSSGQAQPDLAAALSKAAKITTGPKILTGEQMREMVAQVQDQGDAVRGERIFRREDLTCLKCHAIGGAGGRLGPDLVSLGASAQVDYLINSLLQPNEKVKENYHTLVVATDAGQVKTGIKVRQTDTELILRDAEDETIAIPLESILEQLPGASMMPTGLTEKLTHQEFLDLVRFLSEMGRVDRFTIGQERVVRRWRVMNATPEARHRLRRTRYGTAATNDPAYTWSPVYSLVSGALPLQDLPAIPVRNRVAPGDRGVAFVRCELEVTTPGRCEVAVNGADGLKLWVGTNPVTVQPRMELDLSRGIHQLTWAIDLSERKQDLRVDLIDVPGSRAQVQIVGGK